MMLVILMLPMHMFLRRRIVNRLRLAIIIMFLVFLLLILSLMYGLSPLNLVLMITWLLLLLPVSSTHHLLQLVFQIVSLFAHVFNSTVALLGLLASIWKSSLSDSQNVRS